MVSQLEDLTRASRNAWACLRGPASLALLSKLQAAKRNRNVSGFLKLTLGLYVIGVGM